MLQALLVFAAVRNLHTITYLNVQVEPVVYTSFPVFLHTRWSRMRLNWWLRFNRERACVHLSAHDFTTVDAIHCAEQKEVIHIPCTTGGPLEGMRRVKCFEARGLVCTKPHAHVREIIASCGFPLNAHFRMASRAAQCILKNSMLPSWEVWGLKSAPGAVVQRAAALDRPCQFRLVCKRCGGTKAPVSCCQADVNQLFKDVAPALVLQHLQRQVAACAHVHPGCEGVTVLRGKKYQAFVGGHEHTRRGRFFRFWEVCSVFRFYLSCNVFRVGVQLVRQRLGVPIGGSGSKACTSILLGGLEAAWIQEASTRCCHT